MVSHAWPLVRSLEITVWNVVVVSPSARGIANYHHFVIHCQKHTSLIKKS